MSEYTKQVYSETYAILQLLEEEFLSKIPKNLIEILENEKDDTYDVNINPNIPLEEQKLHPDTISLLAMLKVDYWCEDEKEKQELLDIFNRNEEEEQKKIQEQYNPDNLFKNKTTDFEDKIEDSQLIECKESGIKRFLNKLFSLISRK